MNSNLNYFSVIVSDDLAKDDFMIVHYCPCTADDYSLLIKKRIIYDGHKLAQIPEGCIENDFEIIYNDSSYGGVRQLKFDDISDHYYRFRFLKKGDEVFCFIYVFGKYGFRDTIIIDSPKSSYIGYPFENW